MRHKITEKTLEDADISAVKAEINRPDWVIFSRRMMSINVDVYLLSMGYKSGQVVMAAYNGATFTVKFSSRPYSDKHKHDFNVYGIRKDGHFIDDAVGAAIDHFTGRGIEEEIDRHIRNQDRRLRYAQRNLPTSR